MFNLIKSNLPGLQGIEVETEEVAAKNIPYTGKTLVLLGSEKTNIATKKILLQNLNKNVSKYSPLILEYIVTSDNNKALIIYSEKEVNNNQNSAISKSPLSKIMDKKYVPAAATLLSILLLYLWSVVGKTLMDLVSDFVSSKILDRATKHKTLSEKKAKKDKKPTDIVTLKEFIAIVVTSIIFSLTMSWTWSEKLGDLLSMFLLNLAIVGAITAIREVYRQYYCFKHKINTEFLLWPFGLIVTLVSTYFGNTFSLVSYTLVDDSTADEKKFGKLSFFINLLTFALGIIGYLLNIFFPSIILQMIFVYSIMITFIELFPMAPFGGYDIRKWNKCMWLLSYVVVFGAYVYSNFTVYG